MAIAAHFVGDGIVDVAAKMVLVRLSALHGSIDDVAAQLTLPSTVELLGGDAPCALVAPQAGCVVLIKLAGVVGECPLAWTPMLVNQ